MLFDLIFLLVVELDSFAYWKGGLAFQVAYSATSKKEKINAGFQMQLINTKEYRSSK